MYAEPSELNPNIPPLKSSPIAALSSTFQRKAGGLDLEMGQSAKMVAGRIFISIANIFHHFIFCENFFSMQV